MDTKAPVNSSLLMPVLPTGDGTFTPCPELMLEEEAIRYLRLDDSANAARTLRYYRERGLLRGTRVGTHIRYRRVELDRFLELQTADNGPGTGSNRP